MASEAFTVKINIGGARHEEVIKAANASIAAKKASMNIRNTIQKLECTTPTADVYRAVEHGLSHVATFHDLRILLK